MDEEGRDSLTEVFVRFQVEGWHNWPDAPERRAYLRNPHRHMFFYEVRVNINGLGDDRGLEFHDLLDYCKTQTKGGNLGANSCEMLARALAEEIQAWLHDEMDLGDRIVEVTVSEDNECGATVLLG